MDSVTTLRKHNLQRLSYETIPEAQRLEILESGQIGFSGTTDIFNMVYTNLEHTTFINRLLTLMSDDGLKDLVYMICFDGEIAGPKDRELVKAIGKNLNLPNAFIERGWGGRYVHNYVDLFQSDIELLEDDVHEDIDEEVFLYMIEHHHNSHIDIIAAMLANSSAPISQKTLNTLIDLMRISEVSDSDVVQCIIQNHLKSENLAKLTQLAENYWDDGVIEPKYYWFLHCYVNQNMSPLFSLELDEIVAVLNSAMGPGFQNLKLRQCPEYRDFFCKVISAAPIVAQKLSLAQLDLEYGELVRQKL